jgi:pSer/pThr/pTyr-binding forkhead associated (FHA) protein
MPLDAQLEISEAGRPARIFAVRDTMTIGRDSDNDIVLETITVSRCHAVLMHEAAEALLLDLASAIGTLLNGLPIQPDKPVRLNDGDVIRFGQVLVRYVVSNTVDEQHNPPAPAGPPSHDQLPRSE